MLELVKPKNILPQDVSSILFVAQLEYKQAVGCLASVNLKEEQLVRVVVEQEHLFTQK